MAAIARGAMIQRMYLDTSVLGGCFDEEFTEASLALLNMRAQAKLNC